MAHENDPLPKLHDSVLDEDGVDSLFAGIGREAKDVEILLKGDVDRHASEERVELAEARELLRAGKVYAVQLRYTLGETKWLDTLMHVPHGVRLVRMEQTW